MLGKSVKTWFSVFLLGVIPQWGWSFTDQEKHSVLLEFQAYFLSEFGYNSQVTLLDAIESGDSLLINPNGSHYLYSYRENRFGFLRLDRSTFHGHNFGRKLFWYENHLYALGGYGFWVDHSKLIRFNWMTREWDLILTKGEPPGGSPLLCFLRNDSVFFIRSIFRGEANLQPRILSQMWVLDMNALVWTSYLFDPNIGLDGSDYRLSAENEKWYVGTTLPRSQEAIINKETGKFYLNNSGPPILALPELGIFGENLMNDDRAMSYILGDSLFIIYNDSMRFFRADLSRFVFDYCREENVDFNDLGSAIDSANDGMKQMSFVSERLVYWLGLVMLLFLYMVEKRLNKSKANVFAFKTDTMGTNAVQSTSSEQELSLALHERGSRHYSQEDLDELFEIQDLDYDARKLKRSRLIAEVNKLHVGLLERKRDSFDKRKFIYVVNHMKYNG